MAVVAQRVQVVELLVVEPRAAEGAIHRPHHEVRRPVNGGIHRDQVTVGVMEMAQPLAVDAVAGIGQDGAAVPPFVDRPASRAFGKVVFVHQFEVLAGQAELPSDEAWEATQHAAAGFRRGLHRLCRTLRENVEVGPVQVDIQKSQSHGFVPYVIRIDTLTFRSTSRTLHAYPLLRLKIRRSIQRLCPAFTDTFLPFGRRYAYAPRHRHQSLVKAKQSG